MTANPTTLAAARQRGAYFTADDVARLLTGWAWRCDGERILEPSVGDGAFLRALETTAMLRGWGAPRVFGCEIDQATAGRARASSLPDTTIWSGDFLSTTHGVHDVVVGNPPFVRLRHLPAQQRANALAITEQAFGSAMEPSGSVWVPFVVHAVQQLALGGRLAMVLPWELTHVRYAKPLWQFLANNFSTLRVLRFSERVFAGLGQDVICLLAQGHGGSSSVVDFDPLAVVPMGVPKRTAGQPIPVREILGDGRPFQLALAGAEVAQALDLIAPQLRPLHSMARFTIGYVSGDATFFHPELPAREQLPSRSLRPALTAARQLRGTGWDTAGLAAEASTLWLPDPERLTAAERDLIERGEAAQVHRRYKTSNRRPWFVVPGVEQPDVVLSVFSQQPRMLSNSAGLVVSNSFLAGRLVEATAAELITSWYSPISLLHSELGVHSLGGGVLVMIPGEVNGLPVLRQPAADPDRLSALGALLRDDRVAEAYHWGDAILRQRWGSAVVDTLWDGISTLARWRTGRHQRPGFN